MAEKDILEKILMLHADVFADCVNTLVYGGKCRLKTENMQPAPTESFYCGRNGFHDQFCDVSYYLVEKGEITAQYIIENETRLRRRQILRKVSYEGGAYRNQLESGKPIFPVISLVIGWTGKNNRIPMNLHGLLAEYKVPEEDIYLVDDLKLRIYHMRNIPAKIRNSFTSDLGFVVEYLNLGNFDNRKKQKIVHVQALCEMMEALTGDKRFTDMTEELWKKQKERKGIVMCEYIDMLEARGEVRGEAIGENRLAALLEKLFSLGREDDVRLAVQDENARKRLYREFLP